MYLTAQTHVAVDFTRTLRHSGFHCLPDVHTKSIMSSINLKDPSDQSHRFSSRNAKRICLTPPQPPVQKFYISIFTILFILQKQNPSFVIRVYISVYTYMCSMCSNAHMLAYSLVEKPQVQQKFEYGMSLSNVVSNKGIKSPYIKDLLGI